MGFFDRVIGKAEEVLGGVIGKSAATIKRVVGKFEAARKFVEENVPEPIKEAAEAALDATPFGGHARTVYKAARKLAKLAAHLPDEKPPPKPGPPAPPSLQAAMNQAVKLLPKQRKGTKRKFADLTSGYKVKRAR